MDAWGSCVAPIGPSVETYEDCPEDDWPGNNSDPNNGAPGSGGGSVNSSSDNESIDSPVFLTSKYGKTDVINTLISQILANTDVPPECSATQLMSLEISNLSLILDIKEEIAEEVFISLLVALCDGEINAEEFLQELWKEKNSFMNSMKYFPTPTKIIKVRYSTK